MHINWEAVTALSIFTFTVLFGIIGWFVNTAFDLMRQTIKELKDEVVLLRNGLIADKLEFRDKYVTKEEFFRELGFRKNEMLNS